MVLGVPTSELLKTIVISLSSHPIKQFTNVEKNKERTDKFLNNEVPNCNVCQGL